jgi:tetratricopeptide (TPR) repeat protein
MRTKASLGMLLWATAALAQNAAPGAGKKTQLDPQVLQRSGKYFALVIGNNAYNNLPKLETAVKDAQDVSNVLRTLYGFEVKFLPNATRAEIMSGLSEYRRTLTDADNLLIYYAGHGQLDRGADRAYWLPIDAEKDNNANWISADDVTGDLRAMPSRHILVISDSCYSGGFRSAGAEITPADVSQFLLQKKTKRSRTLMSSGALEPVSDGGGAVNSVFAEALIQGLSGTDEQAFSAGRLFDDFVEVRVAGKARQTPLYSAIRNSGDEGGDFVFIRAPKPSTAGSPANSALDSHNRGSLFIADGKFAEAEAEYKMAVSLEPNNAVYHSRLGDALYSERKYAESEKEFREAARLDPANARYKNTLANSMVSQGRWQESEKLYREALALTPDDPGINDNLARALLRRGDAVAAEPFARKAALLSPSEAEYHGNYGDALRALGRPEAIAELTKAVQLNPKLFTFWNALGIAQQVGDPESALNSYKKASELLPNNAVFHSNVASALFNLKRYPEAEAEGKEAVRVDENYAGGHYWLGRALYAQDKRRDSERPLRQAVVLDPADDVKHNWLGNNLDSLGRWDEAILEYKEAIRLKPKAVPYYANLADSLFRAKRPPEADAYYKQAIAIAPNDAELQRHYGVSLVNQNRFEDAKAVFEPIRAREPANAVNWANSGNTMVRLKDFSTGETLLRRAVELDKNTGWYFATLGEALEGEQKFADALQAYQEAQKLAPSTSNSQSVDRVRARLTAQPAKP